MCLTNIKVDTMNSTFNCSSANTSQSHQSQPKKWDTEELNYFVDAGIFTLRPCETEHIALHPFWLSNPLQGLTEEFHDSLGKLRTKSNGYLVAYENVRIDRSKTVAINVDHPWLHIDVQGTLYTYTPEVGQVLKGVVKKIGESAAICVMFHYFSVTVQPAKQSQLSSWRIGNELEFTVKSFRNRRKGPTIQATFTKKLSEFKDVSFMDFNSTTNYGETSQDDNNPGESTARETTATAPSNNFELNLNLSNKLKSKKNKKIVFQDDDEDTSLLASPTKKLKIEHDLQQDLVDGNGIGDDNEESPIVDKKKKKKKKHKSKE